MQEYGVRTTCEYAADRTGVHFSYLPGRWTLKKALMSEQMIKLLVKSKASSVFKSVSNLVVQEKVLIQSIELNQER